MITKKHNLLIGHARKAHAQQSSSNQGPRKHSQATDPHNSLHFPSSDVQAYNEKQQRRRTNTRTHLTVICTDRSRTYLCRQFYRLHTNRHRYLDYLNPNSHRLLFSFIVVAMFYARQWQLTALHALLLQRKACLAIFYRVLILPCIQFGGINTS